MKSDNLIVIAGCGELYSCELGFSGWAKKRTFIQIFG